LPALTAITTAARRVATLRRFVLAADLYQRLSTGEACLVLARMDRKNEALWQKTRSCLGGLPPVSAQNWPMTSMGPMHCAAQIDCAEARAALPDASLPAKGTLVFFVNCLDESCIDKGAVRYVPDGTIVPDLPKDFFPKPPVAMWNQGIVKLAQAGASAANHFPRWPVRLVRSHQTFRTLTPSLDDSIGNAPKDLHLDMHGFARIREHVHTTPTKTWVSRLAEEDFAPHCARVAQTVAQDMRRKLAASTDVPPEIISDFQQVSEQVLQADPLKPLGSALDAEFRQALSSIKKPRSAFGGGTSTSADAARAVYFAMYTGSRSEYEAIPAAMRDQIEAQRLRSGYSSGYAHQMFAFGEDVQGQLDLQNTTLLLQLGTDDAMSFLWGDCGVLQYVIRPVDLAQGNWGAASMVMQSG
jgi:uncharacterized protein YwqG